MPIASLALAALCAVAAVDTPTTTPHNIVVIVIDDAGPELFGVYDRYYSTTTGQPSGYPAATPAIDSMLAAQGMTFTHAWSNPLCSPTRATLLTGRYGFRTGIGNLTHSRPTPLFAGLSHDHVLLPQALRAGSSGYRCLAVGKWHLAERTQLDANPLHPLGSPPGRWFDAWAGTYYQLVVPQELQPGVSAYQAWKKSYAGVLTSQSTPCAPGASPCSEVVTTPPIENYATADVAEDAIACLRDASAPLFLYVAFYGIHTPLHDVPAGLPGPTCPGYTPPATPCQNSANLPEQAAQARCMLEALDRQVARILCEIDFDTTTVILLADNGSGKLGTVAPYVPKHAKSSMFEGGLRVPLIVRSPAIPANLRGTYHSAPINTTDLFATACELAGAPVPPTAVDSVSIVPYLHGATVSQRAHVYAEEFFPHFTPDPSTGAAPPGYAAKHHRQALCDGRFKLIRTSRRAAGSSPTVKEKFFDLLAGAPPAAGSTTPRPDYFEEHDLLLAGSLSTDAAAALASLRATLDTDFPYLTR